MDSGSSNPFEIGDVVAVVRDKCTHDCGCIASPVRGREGTVIRLDSAGKPHEAAQVDFGEIPDLNVPYIRWIHSICLRSATPFPDGVWIDDPQGGGDSGGA